MRLFGLDMNRADAILDVRVRKRRDLRHPFSRSVLTLSVLRLRVKLGCPLPIITRDSYPSSQFLRPGAIHGFVSASRRCSPDLR
jgi:hypothetical protein